MSPMSTAAMNAVADAKAGIASGILSMNRMIGGTLGVAVIGAVFQAAARSNIDSSLAGTGLSASQQDFLVNELPGIAHHFADEHRDCGLHLIRHRPSNRS